MEGGTADSHVDPEGRRCKLDKTQNSAGSSSRSARNKDASLVPSVPPAQAEDVELTKGMGGHLRDHECQLRKCCSGGHSAAKLDCAVRSVLHFCSWFERCGQDCAGTQFLVENSQEVGSEERSLTGPPLEGHPCYPRKRAGAPPEIFQAGIVQRMNEVINLTWVK